MALTDNFVIPPGTALRDFRKEIDDDRKAANLGTLKAALQGSINRTARENIAATVTGAERRKKLDLNIPSSLPEAGINKMLSARDKQDIERIKAGIYAQQQAGLYSGARRGSVAYTAPGQEHAPMSVEDEAKLRQVPTVPLDVRVAQAAREVKEGDVREEAFRTRPTLEGVDVQMGPKDIKTKVQRSIKSRVPTAGEVRSGVGVRGRGAPSAPAKPKAGAKAGAAGTPEAAERLAIQRFAASLGIKKEQVKVLSRKQLGDEGAELIVDVGGGKKHRILID